MGPEMMNRYYSNYSYVHTYPGMPKNRGTNKHRTARKLRAKARNSA